jgi:hypothetical protein
MKDWRLQWEDILIEILVKNGIQCEKTSFSLNSTLTKLRDSDWETILQSGQIVELIYPSKKGGKLKLKATNSNELPIEIGTVNFYNEEKEYKKGILCQLIDKDIIYANGINRTCLEFNQPIILIDSEKIPKDILDSKTLNLKTKGTSKSKSICGGCTGMIIVIVTVALIVYLLR